MCIAALFRREREAESAFKEGGNLPAAGPAAPMRVVPSLWQSCAMGWSWQAQHTAAPGSALLRIGFLWLTLLCFALVSPFLILFGPSEPQQPWLIRFFCFSGSFNSRWNCGLWALLFLLGRQRVGWTDFQP